jgi:hypothetical protein
MEYTEYTQIYCGQTSWNGLLRSPRTRWENKIKMESALLGRQLDKTGSGLYPMVGCDISEFSYEIQFSNY